MLVFWHCCPFNNLEMTRKITQVASEDAGDRGAWLKGSREDFPHLPISQSVLQRPHRRQELRRKATQVALETTESEAR